MGMSILDTILIVSIAGFVFYGLFFGLIRALGTFVGVIAGAIIASRLFLPVSSWIEPIFFGYNNLGKVLVFIVIFSLVNRLVGFVFYLLDKAFDIISIIPFLKTINRLAGAILGFITGGFFIGLILYVASKFVFIENWFGRWLLDSEVSPFLIKFVDILLPLLPEVLKKLQSLV